MLADIIDESVIVAIGYITFLKNKFIDKLIIFFKNNKRTNKLNIEIVILV